MNSENSKSNTTCSKIQEHKSKNINPDFNISARSETRA